MEESQHLEYCSSNTQDKSTHDREIGVKENLDITFKSSIIVY